MAEGPRLQESFRLGYADSLPRFSSPGALKKTLTTGQVKDDLVTLGTHPGPSSPRPTPPGSGVAAGRFSLTTLCHVFTQSCKSFMHETNTIFSVVSSGLNEDKAAHFSQQVPSINSWYYHTYFF